MAFLGLTLFLVAGNTKSVVGLHREWIQTYHCPQLHSSWTLQASYLLKGFRRCSTDMHRIHVPEMHCFRLSCCHETCSLHSWWTPAWMVSLWKTVYWWNSVLAALMGERSEETVQSLRKIATELMLTSPCLALIWLSRSQIAKS